MEQSLEYHRNTLEQQRCTIEILCQKPLQHELAIIELAAKHNILRNQIRSAEDEGREAFDADTYKLEHMLSDLP